MSSQAKRRFVSGLQRIWMRLPAARTRGRRDALALAAVASAVAIAGIAVPLLAAKGERNEPGDWLPSLPVLLTISAISIAAALFALYRLAVEGASATREMEAPGTADPDFSAVPTPAQTLHPSEVAEAAPNGRPKTGAEPASGQRELGATRAEKTTVGDPPSSGPEDLAALVRAEAERLVRELHAESAAREGPPEELATRRPSPDSADPRSRGPRPTRPKRTASVQALPPERTSSAPTGPEDEEKAEISVAETCEVVWWHGAKKGGFEARLDGSRRRPLVIARSRPITWSGDEPPPPEGLAADAHRMLVEKLLEQGWAPASQGHNWYSSRFQRAPTH